MYRNLCLFAAAFLVAGLATASSVQAKTFVSQTGYQLATPESWIMQPVPGKGKSTMVFYCAAGKNGQPALPGIDILARPMEAMTMNKLISYAPWMVAGTYPHFHQTSAFRTSLNGIPAYEIRGTYPRRDRIVSIRELFTTHHGKDYIITTGFPVQQRAKYEAVSNQVIASIRWR